jgi:hypothetical protein
MKLALSSNPRTTKKKEKNCEIQDKLSILTHFLFLYILFRYILEFHFG